VPTPDVLEAVAVNTTLAPVQSVVPDEVKTILGLVTLKLSVLELATLEVKQVPPETEILHFIFEPLTIPELV
jgi:hypothetical protein